MLYTGKLETKRAKFGLKDLSRNCKAVPDGKIIQGTRALEDAEAKAPPKHKHIDGLEHPESEKGHVGVQKVKIWRYRQQKM